MFVKTEKPMQKKSENERQKRQKNQKKDSRLSL